MASFQSDETLVIADFPASAVVAHAVDSNRYQEIQWGAVAFLRPVPGTEEVVFYDRSGNEGARTGSDS